jgi:hypothetical protein
MYDIKCLLIFVSFINASVLFVPFFMNIIAAVMGALLTSVSFSGLSNHVVGSCTILRLLARRYVNEESEGIWKETVEA